MIETTRNQIIIAGATGLIGRELTALLVAAGYKVLVLTRSKSRVETLYPHLVSYIQWDTNFSTWLVREVENSIAVINLAGESIAGKRWTKRRKMQLIRSRLGTTRTLAKACFYAQTKPEAFIQASAVGYYPQSENELFDEQSLPGDNFLSRLTVDWEMVAETEVPKQIRLVILRTGVVLSSKGGMLPQIAKPIRLFAGSWLGSGAQFVSWIDIEDHVRAILFLLQSPIAKGAFNLVAPNPISQKDLVRCIAKKLNRPAILAIPSWILKLAFGQMASELLLAGNKVHPQKLLELGFQFSYPNVVQALDNQLRRLYP
jgi:hypothetical protein